MRHCHNINSISATQNIDIGVNISEDLEQLKSNLNKFKKSNMGGSLLDMDIQVMMMMMMIIIMMMTWTSSSWTGSRTTRKSRPSSSTNLQFRSLIQDLP